MAWTANLWLQKRIGESFGKPVMTDLSTNTKLADFVGGDSIFILKYFSLDILFLKNSVKMVT